MTLRQYQIHIRLMGKHQCHMKELRWKLHVNRPKRSAVSTRLLQMLTFAI